MRFCETWALRAVTQNNPVTVTALFKGGLRPLPPEGQRTGIFKDAVESADVTNEGFVGDHQADRRFHGGSEKALHQYALVGYERIAAEFPQLSGIAVPGSIGENVSSPDLSDSSVYIGDLYRIGPVLVQVSQPRSPCWKINHRFGVEKLSKFIELQRISGWYYRVLEVGTIRVGDAIQLLDRPDDGVSIEQFVDIATSHRPALEGLDSLIRCDGLNPDWKARLAERAAYLRSEI